MASMKGEEISMSTSTTTPSTTTTTTTAKTTDIGDNVIDIANRPNAASLATTIKHQRTHGGKHEPRINSNRLVEELTRRQELQSVPILSRVCRSYIEPSNANIKQIYSTTSAKLSDPKLLNSPQFTTTSRNYSDKNNETTTARNVIIDIRNPPNEALSPVSPSPRSHYQSSTLNSSASAALEKNDHILYSRNKQNQNANKIGQFSQLEMFYTRIGQDNNTTDTPAIEAGATSSASQPTSIALLSKQRTNQNNFQGDQSKKLNQDQIKNTNQQQINFEQVVSFPTSSSASYSSDDQKLFSASGANLRNREGDESYRHNHRPHQQQSQQQPRCLDTDSCEEREEQLVKSPDRDQLSGNQHHHHQQRQHQSYSSSSINDELTTDQNSKKTRNLQQQQQQINDTPSTTNSSIDNQDNQRKNTTTLIETNTIDKQQQQQQQHQQQEQQRLTSKHQKPASFGSTPSLVTRAQFLPYGAKNNNTTYIPSGEHDKVAGGSTSLVSSSNYQNRRHPLQDNIKINGSNNNYFNSNSLNRKNALSKSYSNINNYLSNNHSNNSDRQQHQHQKSISSSRLVDSPNRQNVRYQGYSNISNLFPSLPPSSNNQHNSYIKSRPSAYGGAGGGSSRTASPLVSSLTSSSTSKVNRVTNTLKSLLPSMASSIRPAKNGQQSKRTTIASTSSLTTSRLRRTNSTGSQSMTPSPISRYQSPTATTPTTTVSSSSNIVHRLDRPTTAYSSYSSPMGSRRILSRPSSAASMYKRSPSLSSIPGFDPACPVHGYYSNSNLASDDYYLHSNYYSQPSSKYYGVRHAIPFGSLRSSLAPANEQLRKILGSQPNLKPVHLHPQWAISSPFVHLQQGPTRSRYSPVDEDLNVPDSKPEFIPYNRLEDSQAIRAVDFHPNGEVYAIGSNSRTLRICSYPADHELRHLDSDHIVTTPRILFKFLQVHRGSIYCVAFNTTGDLIATGSNDQTIHVVRYNSITHCPEGDEYKLTMHNGTIRDLCFIDDHTNGSSLLISAGGGDNKIYVTDCDTITPFQSMAGHTAPVLSLHTWGGANFVSGSTDRTIRFWDLRTRGCTSIISAPSSISSSKGPGAPVCAVRVDPTGKVLVSGHNDATCMIYDIRGGRVVQTFKPHHDEIRSVSFSPKAYYLLTAGYDGRVVLTDLQGDLTAPLPSVCVSEIDDKIVQAKWHPTDFTFVTTSANKTATLWALPNN